MNRLPDLITTLGGLPLVTLLFLLAFAVIGLAAYAIYAVHSVAKGNRPK